MWTKELTIEELTEEAMALLSRELEDLYVVLGWQVLASSSPTRVAHIMSRLAGGCKAEAGGGFASGSAFELRVSDWEAALDSVSGDLQHEGILFLATVRDDLRTGLCSVEVLSFSDEISRSGMQIIVMIIAAVLKVPVQIESVSATLAAIVSKIGLKDFCR
jgi:hypothetical protein